MGQAIGGSLALAIGIAISPIPIIAVVLMLTTPRARANGPAFLVGWLLGLGIVGAVVLALAGPAGASQSGKPATWVSWVQIALGVLLLLVALRQFRGRPRDGEDAQMPKWMGAIDKFKPLTALGFAACWPEPTRRTCCWRSPGQPRSPKPVSPEPSRPLPT